MKYLVTFAGPIGSSKSPIAHYLSHQFNLPILSNDVIRTEVIEDLSFLNEEEFRHRAKTRAMDALKSGQPFIFDASVDRQWPNIEAHIQQAQYQVFLISLDISYSFLEKIHAYKQYHDSAGRLRDNYQQHQDFLKQYSSLISVSINDDNFKDRLSISTDALTQWLKEHR